MAQHDDFLDNQPPKIIYKNTSYFVKIYLGIN